MKIDRIAIENLASLRDRQPDIELTGDELGDAGLIAITGATGAGKTTVLDAICLALYDRTPRLRGRGQDPRELLSRGAGSAMAAVDLTLDDGQQWTAEWSVHRAHSRADGVLQPSRQRVVDRTTGEILADGKKPVQALVEQHLDLKFEQFTGVILLAQGEFATFLESSDAERSELLERLTGTEIYSRLGRAAFERHKALRERSAAEEERYRELQPLDSARRTALEQELDELEPSLVRLEQHLSSLTERLQWVERSLRLSARADTTDQALTAARDRFDGVEQDRRRLDAAQHAIALATPLAAARGAQEQALEADHEADRAAAESQDAEAEWSRALDSLALAVGDLAAARAASDRAQGDLEPLEAADEPAITELRDHRRAAVAADHEAQGAAEALASAVADVERLQQLASASARRATAAHHTCRQLDEQCEDLAHRRRRATGNESREGLVARELLLDQAQQVRRQLELLDPEPLEERIAGLRFAGQRCRAERDAAAALRTAARQELESHEELLRLAERGTELARHRHLLVAGEACPLCGSLDHPYSQDGAPEPESALRQAEERRLVLRQKADSADSDLEAAQRQLSRTADDLDRAEEKLQESRRAFAEHSSRWLELRLQLADLPVAAFDIEPPELARLRTQVRDRLQAAEAFDLEQSQLREHLDTAAKAREEAELEMAVAAERASHAEQRRDEQLAARTAAEERREQGWRRWRQAAERLAEACGLELAAAAEGEAATAAAFEQLLIEGRRRFEAAACSSRELAVLEDRVLPRSRHLLAGHRDAGDKSSRKGDPENADLARRFDRLLLQADSCARASEVAADRQRRSADARVAARSRAQAAERQLEEALAGSPFSDAEQLRRSMLEPAALDTLRLTLREVELEVERRRTDHRRSQDDLREHRLLGESLGMGDAEPAESRRQLEAEASDVRGRLRAAADRKMSLQVELRRDDERRRERQAAKDRLGELDHRRRRAARLAHLIGQKDGGKFRRFAQQLNLEQLLDLANLRLDRLAPRYGLARTEGSLDLQVIDRDMADEQRPTSTLSGGESFLVSLALALALADLRRGQLRLGTLFLDEGFGSLDRDTLDTALAALEQLQAEQETQILIISHVGALQERIAHRIEVHKRGGGRSRLRLGVGDGDSDG